jgi:hypothetical protein
LDLDDRWVSEACSGDFDGGGGLFGEGIGDDGGERV